MTPDAGPIIKDAAYFTFWGVVTLLGVSGLWLGIFYLREIRNLLQDIRQLLGGQ